MQTHCQSYVQPTGCTNLLVVLILEMIFLCFFCSFPGVSDAGDARPLPQPWGRWRRSSGFPLIMWRRALISQPWTSPLGSLHQWTIPQLRVEYSHVIAATNKSPDYSSCPPPHTHCQCLGGGGVYNAPGQHTRHQALKLRIGCDLPMYRIPSFRKYPPYRFTASILV